MTSSAQDESLKSVLVERAAIRSTGEFASLLSELSVEEVEAESILARMNEELAVEEALTRQLMIRHGL